MKFTDFVDITPPTPRGQKIGRVNYWRIKIGDAVQEGKTVQQALEKMRTTLEKAFQGNYDPYVIEFRGLLGIMWRDPWQWHFSVRKTNELGTVHGYTPCDSEDEALKVLRYMLAQDGFDGVEEQSPIILDGEDQEHFTRWARWQKRYKELEATGMKDTAIRLQLFEERL